MVYSRNGKCTSNVLCLQWINSAASSPIALFFLPADGPALDVERNADLDLAVPFDFFKLFFGGTTFSVVATAAALGGLFRFPDCLVFMSSLELNLSWENTSERTEMELSRSLQSTHTLSSLLPTTPCQSTPQHTHSLSYSTQ